MSDIILGQEVEDIITGFEGIAVSRVEYLDGSLDIGVRPKYSKQDGKRPNVEYIGPEQLKVIGEGIHIEKYIRRAGFVYKGSSEK